MTHRARRCRARRCCWSSARSAARPGGKARAHPSRRATRPLRTRRACALCTHPSLILAIRWYEGMSRGQGFILRLPQGASCCLTVCIYLPVGVHVCLPLGVQIISLGLYCAWCAASFAMDCFETLENWLASRHAARRAVQCSALVSRIVPHGHTAAVNELKVC